MNFFTSLLSRSSAFCEALAALENGTAPISLTGAADIHKAHIISAMADKLSGRHIVLCRNELVARQMCRDINAFSGRERAFFYPERDFTFNMTETSSREYEQERLGALSSLLSGAGDTLVMPISAAMQFCPSPKLLDGTTFTLKVGESADLDELLDRLVSGGYVRRAQIDGIGQFSVRGGILDVFCPSQSEPYRIEFWGDEIDSISPFDIDTQRRREGVDEFTITPCCESFFNSNELLEILSERLKKAKTDTQKATLSADISLIENGAMFCADKYIPLSSNVAWPIDFISGGVFVCELNDCQEAAKGFFDRLNLQITELVTSGEIPYPCDAFCYSPEAVLDFLTSSRCLLMDTFARKFAVIAPKKFLSIRASMSGGLTLKPSNLPEQLKKSLSDGFSVVLAAKNEVLCDALYRDLTGAGLLCTKNYDCVGTLGTSPMIYIVSAQLSACLEYPAESVSIISFSGENERKEKRKKNKSVFDLSSVSVGDYVVHSAHGIGIFRGIQKLEMQGVYKDYIKIQYGGSDVLYVPVTQLDMVAKYIGAAADDSIKLARLNSTTWKNTKRRVSKAVRDMAKELIALYSKRMQAKGYEFSQDTDWQKDFEDRFPYTETDDQIKCIEDIKRDMESSVPMDRVLCGDVGFGKTEVALRAAMKCVMDSKQCAILVPTTILAWQHYKTALARFDGFPITVAMLSGFISPKQQKETLKKLERGEIDIIIGTHRLIQKDVVFRDLGLAIIDEEQRFGVSHKEKFKEAFTSVDMLTLSATPIPRTLNMAMSGIRDISMLEEAPLDRYPVQTFVLEYNRPLLISAIEKELSRGGQVYYLHNRIETIDKKAAALASSLPNARIAVAHGGMTSQQLEEIWRQLVEHEIDVLVCTTIIETGVDVANCNTLIVEDADRMGLSQLYQLRGRIGRSSRRAYAYFTFRPGKEISDVAAKRLSAIRDFTAFGSGFQIALRDLEIRGAGNILGAQQHGHMDAVGYDMYLKLLNEAIAEEKGEEISVNDAECLIDLPISAHIPNEYIDDNVQRIEIYRRIAMIKTDEDAMDVTDELIDRFGEPPSEVHLLIAVALLRSLAMQVGIVEISQKSDFVVILFDRPDLRLLAATSAQFSRKVFLSNGKMPYLSVKIANKKEMLTTLTDIVDFMVKCKNEEE